MDLNLTVNCSVVGEEFGEVDMDSFVQVVLPVIH